MYIYINPCSEKEYTYNNKSDFQLTVTVIMLSSFRAVMGIVLHIQIEH